MADAVDCGGKKVRLGIWVLEVAPPFLQVGLTWSYLEEQGVVVYERKRVCVCAHACLHPCFNL